MSTLSKENVSYRPFLKWAGGKNKLIPQYKEFFPEFQTYYEPFLGGGAIFFYLCQTRSPFNAVLTDINAELINTYCCVRDNVDDLIDILTKHQINHSESYYYQMRLNNNGDRLNRAARLIYLNKTCFNGLYRENSQGEFNVPIGKYKNPSICNRDLLYSASASLQSAKVEVRAFQEVLKYANDSNDFVYFDPPYYPLSSTSSFTAYSRDRFSEGDQVKLKEVFTELADRGVKVMLSNSDCEFIRELYKQFKIHVILAPRAINSDAKKRGKISELLVTSY